MSDNKKITEELHKIKDHLTYDKLQKVNFKTLDLTEIVEKSVSEPVNNIEKNQVTPDALNKSVTIEKLMIKLLEPELKKWLDKNLPGIVKEIIKNQKNDS